MKLKLKLRPRKDAPTQPANFAASPADVQYTERLERLTRVLRASGFMIDLQLNFLHGQSKADSLLLLGVKDALEARNMTLHQATVAAHGFMYAGTANTAFVREQMDWFKKSSNWM